MSRAREVSKITTNVPSVYATDTELISALTGYITSSTASAVYLSQLEGLARSSASSTYLTQTDASSTYLTQPNASAIYLRQSSASTTYTPQSSPVVGFKNKIINGDFRIWQRGTTFFNPASNSYTADRWFTNSSGTVPTSYTISQQTFTPGISSTIGVESDYFYRSLITTVSAGTRCSHSQKIESVMTFANQTVIVSFWAKADSNRSTLVYLLQNFGTGGSSQTVAGLLTASITSSWTRFSFIVSVPSISGKTIGVGNNLELRFDQVLANGSTLDIWGIQIEKGSIATDFEERFIGTELQMCQRYYHQDSLMAIDGYGSAGMPLVKQFYFPVKMRISPASTTTQTGSVNTSLNTSNTTFTIDPPTSNENFINMYIISTNAGRTHLYRPIQFNAEL